MPENHTLRRKLLKLVTTVPIPKCGYFDASLHARIDLSDEATVRVAEISMSFRREFSQKIEPGCAAASLKVYSLLQSSIGFPILRGLGGEAEVLLARFWHLLEKQGRGQAGALLLNGHANVAFIRNQKGELRMVSARWNAAERGWILGALPITDQFGWLANCQIIAL